MDNFPEIADLEVLELRKKVKELELKLSQCESVMKEAGLIDRVSKVSDTEEICVRELQRYNDLSKTTALQNEDIKNIEILAKTLQLARGKIVIEEKKQTKKEKPDIGKLLKLAEGKNE